MKGNKGSHHKCDLTDDTPENYRCFSTCGSPFRLNLTIVLDFQDQPSLRTLSVKVNYIYTLYETDQKCSQMSCLFTFLKLVHIYKLCFLTICIYCIYLLNLVDKMCNQESNAILTIKSSVYELNLFHFFKENDLKIPNNIRSFNNYVIFYLYYNYKINEHTGQFSFSNIYHVRCIIAWIARSKGFLFYKTVYSRVQKM